MVLANPTYISRCNIFTCRHPASVRAGQLLGHRRRGSFCSWWWWWWWRSRLYAPFCTWEIRCVCMRVDTGVDV